MNRKTLDRLPLIKLDRILDWAPIQQYLTNRKICCLCVNVGCTPILCSLSSTLS